jgi:hypothetical protein
MEGKRFGFGLAAGLLLGLAVIVASAGFGTGSLYGTFGSLSSSQSPATAVTTASSTTVTQVATTSAQPNTTGSGNSTTPPQSIVTTTQGSNTFGNSAGNAVNKGLSSLSSNVNSISNQPLVSNAVIFVPVFVAFLLGAAIYRASRQPDEEEI